MATRTWLDVDGNYNNTANWSGGVVPASGDTAIIATGNKDIVSGMDQSAVNPANVYIGQSFRGTIGTPASPLKYGTVTLLRYDAPLCKSCNLWPATCTTAVIQSAHPIADAFYGVNGTWTKLIVVGGPAIRFGASCTLTSLIVGPVTGSSAGIGITLDSGLTLTAALLLGGNVLCYSAAVTLNVAGGRWQHLGTATYNITTLNLWAGGRFEYRSPAATITKVNAYGGSFECAGDDDTKTITDLDAYPGAYVNLDNGVNTIICTSPPNDYGAGIIGLQTITRWVAKGGQGVGAG